MEYKHVLGTFRFHFSNIHYRYSIIRSLDTISQNIEIRFFWSSSLLPESIPILKNHAMPYPACFPSNFHVLVRVPPTPRRLKLAPILFGQPFLPFLLPLPCVNNIH